LDQKGLEACSWMTISQLWNFSLEALVQLREQLFIINEKNLTKLAKQKVMKKQGDDTEGFIRQNS